MVPMNCKSALLVSTRLVGLRLLFATLAILGLALRVSAQGLPDRGFLPTRSYDPSSTDDINLQGGTLIYRVPLYSFPAGAGGQSWNVGLSYNSSIYDPDPTYPYTNTAAPSLYSSETSFTGGGWQWSYRYQLVVRYPDNHVYVVFPDGSHHLFFLRNAIGDSPNTVYPYMSNGNESVDPGGGDSNAVCTYHLAGRTLVYYSADTSFLRLAGCGKSLEKVPETCDLRIVSDV
jgi:hypothetical protein